MYEVLYALKMAMGDLKSSSFVFHMDVVKIVFIERQSQGLQLRWCRFFISGAGTVLWCAVLEELWKL